MKVGLAMGELSVIEKLVQEMRMKQGVVFTRQVNT